MTNQEIKTRNKKEKRNNHFMLRLNDSELQKLTLKAESYNLSNARYIRQIIDDLPLPIERVKDLPKIDPKLISQIASIGNNINQLTRLAHSQNNTFGIFDIQKLQLSLDRISNELSLLRDQFSVKQD